jgi:hypothetical protein
MTTTHTPAPASNAAKYRKFEFRHNSGKTYTRPPQLGNFKKVPDRLRVEETWQEHIRRNGAPYTAHDGKKDGEHEFFTGLLPVPTMVRCYVGNHHANGKRSLCLFRFSESLEVMELFFFNHYYHHDRAERLEYARQFLANH